jgi:hypothetical protein
VCEGATFVLGFEGGPDAGTIRGGVRPDAPASLQLHNAHISGGLRVGGGGAPTPGFSTVEDNVIRGGATIDGLSRWWFGFIRNHVRGAVKLNNNVMTHPDATEYVTNTIKGNLVCQNSPRLRWAIRRASPTSSQDRRSISATRRVCDRRPIGRPETVI